MGDGNKDKDVANIMVHSGKYHKVYINQIIYIVAKESEVKAEKIKVKYPDLLNEFISIDINDIDDILNFTNKYGPIINIEWGEFEKAAIREDPRYILGEDKYPFIGVCAFPEYQFKFFYYLIRDIWKLQKNIVEKADHKHFIRNFLQLLFQPYAKCDYEDKYLGVPCDEAIGGFSYFYSQAVKREISTTTVASFLSASNAIVELNIKRNKGKKLEDIVICRDISVVNKETMEKWEITFLNEFIIFAMIKEYDELFSVLNELVNTDIFDYLDASKDEIKYNVKNPNYQIYERIRKLSRKLIQDIVNTYMSPSRLDVNDELKFEVSNNVNYLIQTLFDALAVTLVDYELRVCGFRSCKTKLFIAKKGRKKDFCCKACADKENKYQIREGRRTKKERKPKKK